MKKLKRNIIALEELVSASQGGDGGCCNNVDISQANANPMGGRNSRSSGQASSNSNNSNGNNSNNSSSTI